MLLFPNKDCMIPFELANSLDPDEMPHYFSTKTYIVGTQKNRLNKTVFFEHPKQMLKMMGKKIFTICFVCLI